MMRHAHSEERDQNIRDHERPITQAGRVSARQVVISTMQRHARLYDHHTRLA